VADVVVEGIAAERFLITTRPGYERVLTEKGTDYDAWIGQAAAGFLGSPPPAGASPHVFWTERSVYETLRLP
jgi:hypothetical protein